MTPQQAQIKRATIAAQRGVVRLDAAAIDALEQVYRQAADDIKARIGAYAGSDGNVALYQLQDLLAQVNARLRELSAQRDGLINDGLAQAAGLGTAPLDGVLSSAASMQINHDAVAFVRAFVADDGLQLSDRIWRLDRQARDLVTNAIESAVIQGHGAVQAARDLLTQGKPVPIDLQNKLDSANAARMGKDASAALLTGNGSPMDNAMRVMRTEINRAHGEAYIKGVLEHPDAAGIRFKLSLGHPKHDICDLHAEANLYGLGKGVYPTRESCPWPAHPNTLSFVEVVFKDEITDADRAGKETPMQALARMTPAQRLGVLGKNKAAVFDAGGLKQGMIKAPWRAVKKRIGQVEVVPPTPQPTLPHTAKPKNYDLDGMIAAGDSIAEKLIQDSRRADGSVDGEALLQNLHQALSAARPLGTEAKVANGGAGAALVKAASRLFPDDWTRVADKLGPLYVKKSDTRGGQVTLSGERAGMVYRVFGFNGVARGGEGFIRGGSFSTMVHEYGHRLQHAIPELDDFFQELHGRRTTGDPLRRLKDLFPGYGYGRSEVAREDKYRNAYQGKIYSGFSYLGKHGAMAVLTMAFQDVLGGKPRDLEDLVGKDREMLNLVIGLLFNYVP